MGRRQPVILERPHEAPEYCAFTAQFDQTVPWDKAATAADVSYLPTPNSIITNAYDYQIWYQENDEFLKAFSTKLISDLKGEELPEVMILVDHSGSLRGGKNVVASALMKILDNVLLQAGVKFEIIGFTTSSWRGGQSKSLWERQGAPLFPGRLCDLLHIIYRSSDDTSDENDRYDLIFDERLLKENIDGEAIEFALDRLREFQRRRGLILHISDGAPVDDATITHNWGTFLTDHLRLVLERIAALEATEIAAIGVGYEVDGFFPSSTAVHELDQIGDELFQFLRSALLGEMEA